LTLKTFAASLLIHLVILLATWNVDLIGAGGPMTAHADQDAVVLQIIPDEGPARNPGQPTTYTDIPQRAAAEEPPERADFLALHDSRAADLLPGGESSARPAAPEQSPVEQVAIQRENLADSPGVAVLPVEAAAQQLPGSVPERKPADTGEAADEPIAPGGQEPARDNVTDSASPSDPPQSDSAAALPLPRLQSDTPSILKPTEAGPLGDAGFDFNQSATGRLDGNALQTGGYQLNTWEWNWAPWMQQFGQGIRRHWFAPYAYSLGVIDGRTRVRVVVEPDGRLSALEVQESVGHESLAQASVAAVNAAAPFAPLPADFPEDRLVIILTLHYPAWKAEPPPRTAAPAGPRRRTR
jgi:TonB family protein